MRIAIHETKGGFSKKWIEYCQSNSVPYKIVNCYDSDIIKQLDDCGALMWHHQQWDYRDALVAKSIDFFGKSNHIET